MDKETQKKLVDIRTSAHNELKEISTVVGGQVDRAVAALVQAKASKDTIAIVEQIKSVAGEAVASGMNKINMLVANRSDL